MYFYCVLCETILKVAQNAQKCVLSVISECNNFPLVINTICGSAGICFENPRLVEKIEFYIIDLYFAVNQQ